MKEIVYVDMDDVLCDYINALRSAKIKTGLIYPQSAYGFFLNLQPLPGAIRGYNALTSVYDVMILTRPSVYNPMSYTEKRAWIEAHLGFSECKNLILSCDKTLLRGKYLIDDMEQYGRCTPEWEHIQFGTSKFPDWNSIVQYLIPEKLIW